MHLSNWAQRHGISPEAMQDLRANVLGQREETAISIHQGMSESSVSQRNEQALVELGGILWRNNVGVAEDKRGIPVRYGLANVSTKMNKQTKSGDQVGILPLVIRPDHVGKTFGLFISIEDKKSAWVWKGDAHELAQANWAELVTLHGGVAMFVNDPIQIEALRYL